MKETYEIILWKKNEDDTLMRIILEAYNQYLIMNQQDEYRDLIEGLIKKTIIFIKKQ